MKKISLVLGLIFAAQYVVAETDCAKDYNRGLKKPSSSLSTHLEAVAKNGYVNPSGNCYKGKAPLSGDECTNYLSLGYIQPDWKLSDCEAACNSGFKAAAQKYVSTHNSALCTDKGKTFQVQLFASGNIGGDPAPNGQAFGIVRKTANAKSCTCSFDLKFAEVRPVKKSAPKEGSGKAVN